MRRYASHANNAINWTWQGQHGWPKKATYHAFGKRNKEDGNTNTQIHASVRHAAKYKEGNHALCLTKESNSSQGC